MSYSKKYFLVIGYIVCSVMIGLSLYYGVLRMAYADNAYVVFSMINSNSFLIAHNRFVLILTQLLPVIAIKLQMPLKIVMTAYSVNFYLLYTLIFIIIVHVLKNLKIGIAYLLVLILFMGRIFYFQSEIILGLSFLMILLAFIEFSYNKHYGSVLFYAISAMLTFMIISSHTIMVFPLAFVFIYPCLAGNKIKPVLKYLILLTLLVLGFIIKLMLTPSDSYEGNYITTISDIELWRNALSLFPTRFFISNSYTYLPGIMLLVGIAVFLFYKKEFLKAIFILFSFSIYFVVINVVFHTGDAPAGMERIYLPIAVFAVVPFITDYWTDFRKLMWIKIIVGVIFLVSLIRINQSAKEFIIRYRIVKAACERLQNLPGNRFYFYEHEIKDRLELLAVWAISIESLLISTANCNKQVTIFMSNDLNNIHKVKEMHSNLFMHVSFLPFINAETDLNPNYFHLTPSQYSHIDASKYLIHKQK